MNMRRTLLVGWMALIFIMSHDAESGTHSGWLLELLRFLSPLAPPEIAHLLLRKLAHFTEYFVLFALWRFNGVSGPWAFLFSAFYAFSDELHQAFVPGRVAAPLDVAIDTAGVLTAWALARLKALLVCCTPQPSD